MALQLTIEGLPPMNTSDSRGSHWSHSKLKRTWGNRVWAAVRLAYPGTGKPPKPLERAHVTIVRCSQSEPDYDNLVQGGKFLLDGLVLAGVLKDDKPSVIGRPDYLWERRPRGKGCVRIRVEAVEEGGA